MDLVTQAERMTPEAVAALLRRNYKLECESKVRRKEAKLLREELAQRDNKVADLSGKLANAGAHAEQLKAQTKQLKIQLAWLKKQVFGAMASGLSISLRFRGFCA